jgi:AraC family transcriptional regulator
MSRRLPWGSFFGDAAREVRTATFEFSDRIAVVPDREVPEHTHLNAHFVFVVRGTYITEARNRPGVCGASTLIFNPAGTTHRDRFRSDLGRFFTVSVSNDIAGHVEAKHPAAISFGDADLVSVARQAQVELHRADALSALILDGLGLELAGRAARWIIDRAGTIPRWLVRVRDSIHDRCTSKLTVRELADEAGVHPIHLARSFRRHFAASPGEYLRRCRLEKARELLAATDLPLAELALTAGFSDQSQLTNAFRRATGHTPRAFRRFVRG